MMTKPGTVASAVGLGLAAGLAGTAAMSASSAIEAKLRGRPESTAPADAAAKVLGVHPDGPEQAKRFGAMVHWAYGTSWGAVRGLLGCTALPAPAATAIHMAALWATEAVMLPALGVAPPPHKWGGTEIAIDAWHHLTYAATTGAAYQVLDHSR
jgi:hypothetical protein